MQNNYNLTVRRLVPIVLAVVAALILLVSGGEWLYHYFTTGNLVVTTNSKYTDISVLPVSNKSNVSRQGSGSLAVSLHTGEYYVSVENGSNGTSQYVKVKGRNATTRISLQTAKPSGIAPVVYGNLQNVAADSSHLAYLDQTTGIHYIDTSNNDSVVPNTNGFLSAAWASPTYGVGLDSSQGLFVINNTSVTPLTSPVSASDSAGTLYAVTPNRTIYVASGSALYSGTASSGLKQIYTNKSSNDALAAGNNEVASITTGLNGTKPQVVVVRKDGKTAHKNFDASITGWSPWSPGDKYIAILAGRTGRIFDTSLHPVASIPESSISYATWLDDNTLLYSVGSELWSYSVAQQRSQIIGNAPLNEQIKSLSVSTDKTAIYLTTLDSYTNQVDAIRRINLKGQPVPDVVYRLQLLLPITENDYSISMVNFAGTPTIVVSVPVDSERASSLQSAQTTLQGLVDISGLQFTTALIPEG